MNGNESMNREQWLETFREKGCYNTSIEHSELGYIWRWGAHSSKCYFADEKSALIGLIVFLDALFEKFENMRRGDE